MEELWTGCLQVFVQMLIGLAFGKLSSCPNFFPGSFLSGCLVKGACYPHMAAAATLFTKEYTFKGSPGSIYQLMFTPGSSLAPKFSISECSGR
jgi:hypothetical protein